MDPNAILAFFGFTTLIVLLSVGPKLVRKATCVFSGHSFRSNCGVCAHVAATESRSARLVPRLPDVQYVQPTQRYPATRLVTKL